MQNKYSPSMNTFFLAEFMHRYELAGTLPEDAIEVSDEVLNEYTIVPPKGIVRIAGSDGLPAWSEIIYDSESTAN